MTHSVLSFLVITAALPFVVSKCDCGFRKLNPDEIFPVLAWLPQIDAFKVKSCGPPGYFSPSVTPVPVMAGQFGRLEINFTAAHDLISGNFIVNYNRWPYHLEVDACDYFRHKFGVKLCPIAKGETYYLYGAGILYVPEIEKGHLFGNITLVNRDNEVILCLDADVYI